MDARITLAVPLLTACHAVFGVDPAPLPPDAFVEPPVDQLVPPVDCFFDNFDDNEIDGSKWRVQNLNYQSAEIVERSQQLQIILGASAGATNNALYSNPLDLTDAALIAEIPGVVSQTGGVENILELAGTGAQHYQNAAGAGKLRFRTRNTDSGDQANSTAYDALADRWWRIAHDSSRQRVTYATSPDGVQWVQHFESSDAIGVDSLVIRLIGVIESPHLNPGTARYDNLRIQRARCP